MGRLQLLRLRILASIAKGRVLDVGSGDSYLDEIIASSGLEVVAVDFVTAFLHEIRMRNKSKDFKIAYVRACVEALPFRNATFDTIIMAELIEHLPRPDKAIFGMMDYLAKNGHVLISTPNRLTNPTGVGTPSHLNVFTYWSLYKLLERFSMNVRFKPYPLFPALPASLHRLLYRVGFRKYAVTEVKHRGVLETLLYKVTKVTMHIFPLAPFLAFSLICEAWLSEGARIKK